MSAPVLLALPFLMTIVAALVLVGAPVRPALIGLVLVALSTGAAARVPGGIPSFQLINGVMLYGGLLLFGLATARSLTRGRPDFTAMPVTARGAPASVVPQVVRRWGMPVLLGLLLIPSLWFVVTVAGADARSLQDLRDAPFSPAGETLLAALLLPATLVLAGAWPFAVVAGGPRLAPVGALLLLVVVVPMLPEGLEHWRSAYAGWLVVAAMMGAATANWPRVMACAGLFAIACGSGVAFWAGAALTVVASVLSRTLPIGEALRRLAYLVAGACGIAALRLTLANEVVYSVLMLLAVVVGVLRAPVRATSAA